MNRKQRQKGQVLLIVLVLLLLASTIIMSSLTFVGTSLKTNKTFNNNTISTYAAEAGIQDAIWQMLNRSPDDLRTNLLTPDNTYDVYDFNSTWSYTLADPAGTDPNYKINGFTVSPQLKNIWVPMIDADNTSWIPSPNNLLPPDGAITPPSASEAKSIINNTYGTANTDLTMTGQVVNPTTHEVEVQVYYSGTVSLPIISIGVWLPQGYSYQEGTSNLKDASGSWLFDTTPTGDATFPYKGEQVVKCAGNEAVIWTFPAPTSFASLFPFIGQSGANTLAIDFNYSGNLEKLPAPLAWMTVSPNTDFPYSYTWDANVNVTNIISGAGSTPTSGTEIEAYVPKSSTRSIGAAMSGDYVAAGNSLLTMATWNSSGVRTALVSYPNTSSYTVNTIPSDANVQGAYLYWSGWLSGTQAAEPIGAAHGGLIDFKIDDNQVYFDTYGNPARGPGTISYSKLQKRDNTPSGTGYSYSCYKDVTELVRWELEQEYPGATDYPGNAKYSVGPASSCQLADPTGSEWAYAGWSLVVIYSSPETLGHQLYLYDKFSYADNVTDIDPTGNTTGNGGTISGFLVPQPVVGDVDAAKLTCFVGDGDFCYAGDFLALNAPQQYWTGAYPNGPWSIPDGNPSKLWDGINLPTYSNTSSAPDNVWNSYSQTGLSDGVDIKTFHITWASGLIQPGDTSARIDLPTNIDSWNLVYIILSFRSSVTTGGSVSYLVRRKQ